jgi:hypothetical protein
LAGKTESDLRGLTLQRQNASECPHDNKHNYRLSVIRQFRN